MHGYQEDRGGVQMSQQANDYYSIYNSTHEPGRERARFIISRPVREAYIAVMDALDEGWRILHPIAAVAEAYAMNQVPCWPEALALAWVLRVDVVDEYRGVVFDCWESVPQAQGSNRPMIANAVDECCEIERYLHVVELAARSDRCPVEIQQLIGPVRQSFVHWLERFKGIVAPVAAIEYGCELDGAPPPLVSKTARL
jgi:hypothetical protein